MVARDACDAYSRFSPMDSVFMLFWLRFGLSTLKLTNMHFRTQMFIDAEARMDTYEDKDGVKRTQLNLLMRKST